MMTVGRAATIGLLALALSAPAVARHKESSVDILEFEVIEGLAVVQVKTNSAASACSPTPAQTPLH